MLTRNMKREAKLSHDNTNDVSSLFHYDLYLQMHRSAWIEGLGHAVGSQYCAPSHLPAPAVEHCVQSAWQATQSNDNLQNKLTLLKQYRVR